MEIIKEANTYTRKDRPKIDISELNAVFAKRKQDLIESSNVKDQINRTPLSIETKFKGIRIKQKTKIPFHHYTFSKKSPAQMITDFKKRMNSLTQKTQEYNRTQALAKSRAKKAANLDTQKGLGKLNQIRDQVKLIKECSIGGGSLDLAANKPMNDRLREKLDKAVEEGKTKVVIELEGGVSGRYSEAIKTKLRQLNRKIEFVEQKVGELSAHDVPRFLLDGHDIDTASEKVFTHFKFLSTGGYQSLEKEVKDTFEMLRNFYTKLDKSLQEDIRLNKNQIREVKNRVECAKIQHRFSDCVGELHIFFESIKQLCRDTQDVEGNIEHIQERRAITEEDFGEIFELVDVISRLLENSDKEMYEKVREIEAQLKQQTTTEE